jgi:hypothetical protein
MSSSYYSSSYYQRPDVREEPFSSSSSSSLASSSLESKEEKKTSREEPIRGLDFEEDKTKLLKKLSRKRSSKKTFEEKTGEEIEKEFSDISSFEDVLKLKGLSLDILADNDPRKIAIMQQAMMFDSIGQKFCTDERKLSETSKEENKEYLEKMMMIGSRGILSREKERDLVVRSDGNCIVLGDGRYLYNYEENYVVDMNNVEIPKMKAGEDYEEDYKDADLIKTTDYKFEKDAVKELKDYIIVDRKYIDQKEGTYVFRNNDLLTGKVNDPVLYLDQKIGTVHRVGTNKIVMHDEKAIRIIDVDEGYNKSKLYNFGKYNYNNSSFMYGKFSDNIYIVTKDTILMLIPNDNNLYRLAKYFDEEEEDHKKRYLIRKVIEIDKDNIFVFNKDGHVYNINTSLVKDKYPFRKIYPGMVTRDLVTFMKTGDSSTIFYTKGYIYMGPPVKEADRRMRRAVDELREYIIFDPFKRKVVGNDHFPGGKAYNVTLGRVFHVDHGGFELYYT